MIELRRGRLAIAVAAWCSGVAAGVLVGQWWTDRQWRTVDAQERRIADVRMQIVADACDVRIYNVLTRLDRSGCFGTWSTADGEPTLEPVGRKVAKR